MFRVIFYLLGIVVLISILRSVIGWIAQVFGNPASSSQGTAGSGTSSRKPAVPISEALKKDPVCGAFVAPSTAVEMIVGSTTHYFCSTTCRDKYAG